MKKIILIIIILLCSACYDYTEINELGIISGLGIDYVDDTYYVTYEVVSTKEQKEAKEKENKSYIVEGSGKNIMEALNDANSNLAKKPYFTHLKVCLITSNVDVLNISDYIIRNTNITTNFILVLNDNPKNVLEFKSKNEPINSLAIYNLLKKNDYTKLENVFDQQVAKLIEKNEDLVIPRVSVEDEIKLDTYGIYRDNKLYRYLSEEEQRVYDYLTKPGDVMVYKDNEAILLYNAKKGVKVKDKEVTIKLDLKAAIEALAEDYNLRSSKTYEELKDEYSEIINEEVSSLAKGLQEEQIDILGIKKAYYIKNGKKCELEDYQNLNIKVEVNLRVNKPGLLFGVIK